MSFFWFFKSVLMLVGNILTSIGLSSQKNKTANKTTGNYTAEKPGIKEWIKTTLSEAQDPEQQNLSQNELVVTDPLKVKAQELQNLYEDAKVTNDIELRVWRNGAEMDKWWTDTNDVIKARFPGRQQEPLHKILLDINVTSSIREAEWLIHLFKLMVGGQEDTYAQGLGKVLAHLEETGNLQSPKVSTADQLDKVRAVVHTYNDIVKTPLKAGDIGDDMNYETLANWLVKNGDIDAASMVMVPSSLTIERNRVMAINIILRDKFVQIEPLLDKFAPLLMNTGLSAKQILIEELKCLKSLINEK